MASEEHDPPNDAPSPEQAPTSDEKTASESAPGDATSSEPMPYELPIPHWLFSMIGHVIAAATGLALGYLILHWLRPGKFPLPW
jgi:hypothetical protein